jgi:cytochrome c oxidase subunit 4
MTAHQPRSYLITWALLLALAAASYVLSTVATPVWGVPLALGVAACKALLIVFFFMHIARYAVSARLTLAVAVTLILLLGGFMAADLMTRAPAGHALRSAGAAPP